MDSWIAKLLRKIKCNQTKEFVSLLFDMEIISKKSELLELLDVSYEKLTGLNGLSIGQVHYVCKKYNITGFYDDLARDCEVGCVET